MSDRPGPADGDVADRRPALVVGASGKTGRAVCAALVARGVRVRAAVRPGREDAAPPGTEAVPVDLAQGQGLEATLDGARAAYHLAPNVHPDEVGIARRVGIAASAVGLPRLVFHSVLHPDDQRMPHHLRKAEAERVLRDLLPGRVVVLRPAAYHQNLLEPALAGRITVPYSLDAPFSNVDLDDVAEVAAMALTEEGHAGQTYELCGPEALSVRELAAIAREVLGREVAAIEEPISDWLGGPGADLDPSARRDLEAMFRTYDREGFVGDATTLEHLIQRRPRTWRDALERAIARAQPS